jgi:hypothetical protein
VRWLEDYRDETERRVREALDAAGTRNDDLALRRVWSRLADLVPRAPRGVGKLRWPALMSVAGLLAGAAMVALLLGPLLEEVTRRWPSAISATLSKRPPRELAAPVAAEMAPAVPAIPAPAFEGLPDADPAPLLVGPITVHTAASEARTVRLRSGARVYLRGRGTLEIDAGQRPFLKYGRARLEVARQPPGETFNIAAGPYVVVVVGTKFTLGVSSRLVTVDVREGAVQIWKGDRMTPLPAGGSWKGPNRGNASRSRLRTSLRSPAPKRTPAHVQIDSPQPRPPSSSVDTYEDALAAFARNDTAIGLDMLRRLSEGHGPSAENAGFVIGRILRDQLHQPRQAIVTWRRYRQRFPDGLLRHEADVSIIETLLTQGDTPSLRVEVEAFLRRHPHSERHAEMKALAARLAGAPPVGGASVLRAR